MASQSTYINNKIEDYSIEFINEEFLKVYHITPAEIIRVSDYRCNTEYDKYGELEFNINLFICFIKNDECGRCYHIHHYYEDFHWHHIQKFTYKLHKLFKFPFTPMGKTQVDEFFRQMALQYDNYEYLF